MSGNLPQFGKSSFHCPHCGVFADQAWRDLYTIDGVPIREVKDSSVQITDITSLPTVRRAATNVIENLRVSVCRYCYLPAIWWGTQLAHPDGKSMPTPHPDMPTSTRTIYEEARAVYRHSPRAAAGLLRLAMEDLLKHLDIEGNSLAARIKHLHEQGLPSELIEAMEIIRITGNDALHAGEIRLHEDAIAAPVLFDILNTLVGSKISFRKRIASISSKLPQEKKSLLSRLKPAAVPTHEENSQSLD